MSNPPWQVCWWPAGRSGQYLRVLWSPWEAPWQYLWFTVGSWPLDSQGVSIVPEPPCSPVPPLAAFLCPWQGSPILQTWGRDTVQGSRGWLAMSFVLGTSSTILGTAESKSVNSCILIESITKSCLGDHVLPVMVPDVLCPACCNNFLWNQTQNIKYTSSTLKITQYLHLHQDSVIIQGMIPSIASY